jgi:hypothetical protein
MPPAGTVLNRRLRRPIRRIDGIWADQTVLELSTDCLRTRLDRDY